jgi:integrase
LSKPYQNFLDILDSKEPQTKDKYIEYFDYYLQFLKVIDPNSLIIKRFYPPQEIAKIEDKIIGYIDYLKKQRKNQSTIKGRVYAIFKFYTANRINLDRKHIAQYIPSRDKPREDEPYTTSDIQKMLGAITNPRDKFMLYLLSSTGMRVGALSTLTYGDIEPMKPEGYQGDHIYKIVIYRGHRSEYYTFTSFECAEELDEYLNYRKRNEEVITKESPLLRNQLNSNITSINKKNRPKFVISFGNVVDRIANRAGVRTRTHDKQTKHKNMLDHAFRKFAITQMINAGVEYDTREFLTGHKTTRGLDNSYSRVPVAKRLEEYMKAVEFLTISPENRLRKKLAESEMTINMKLAEKDSQVRQLMKQMEIMNKRTKVLETLVRNPTKLTEMVRK